VINKLSEVSNYFDDIWVPRLQLGHNEESGSGIHYGLSPDPLEAGEGMPPKERTNRIVSKAVDTYRPFKPITQRVHILDVGCGVGGTMNYLSEQHPEWFMSGICSGMQEYRTACRLFPAMMLRMPAGGGGDGHSIMVGDFHEEFSFTHPLHGAYALESLCQSWDKARVLSNVFKALVPGGVFVVVDAHLEEDADLDDPKIEKLYRDVKEGFYVPDLYERGLMLQLVDAGFEIRSDIDLTANVAPSIFESAGRAMHINGTQCVPLRMQLHCMACIGMAGLLAHKEIRYRVTTCNKPECMEDNSDASATTTE